MKTEGQAGTGLFPSFKNERQDMTEQPGNPDLLTKQFLSLLLASQRQISSYIGVLVPNFNDADDILQQTITVMWEKFGQYKPGTDFAAWGVRIAYFNILRYRKANRKTKLQLSDTVFQSFCEVMERKYSRTDEKLSALRSCIQKLAAADKRFLHLRYGMNQSVHGIAQQTRKSIQYIYRTLTRIHQMLHRCIHRTLAEEGTP